MPYRYSVIIGNLGNTKDRFCGSYKDTPDKPAMIRAAAGIPHVEGVELVGTWDVTPANAAEMAEVLKGEGLTCVSVIPDLFSQAHFGKGSYSHHDPATRQRAIDETLQLCQTLNVLGCDLVNLWPGQDGFDYLLAADHLGQRERFADAVRHIAEAFPQTRFALEYKPKEPRCFSLIARMADTLLMCNEVDRDNVGVCIDTGHSYVAGEAIGEAIALAKRHGTQGVGSGKTRLFHMHVNDNHGLWDDDMIAGTIHSTTYPEMFHWLERTGYDGWISMDQYPFREDAADAIGESILWLRHYEKLAAEHQGVLASATAAEDGVATSRALRTLMGVQA